MFKVMIHPGTYENVARAVDRAFEIFPLELKDKKVLVKPNVLRLSEAKEGIVTNPAVLRAVVEKVESLNPSEIVVGDNPGVQSYGANEESFKRTGLMDAARGHYVNIGNESEKVEFNPAFVPHVSVSRIVLEADIIISLPKFKTHGLTVMTGAIKNSYGFLPGAQKARLHKAAGTPEGFHEMLVDVFRIRVPDLFIVDAVVGMEGNGPACADLRQIGVILASDNAVAVDGVISTMMGCPPEKLRFLRKAKDAGLGEYDPAKNEIIGELRKISGFKLPPLSGEVITRNENIQEAIHQRTLLRPKADPLLCTGCSTCIDQCPVSALSLNDDVPRVDPDRCITCFCCQEVCPEKAITLQ
ncbi:MAG: DUF362 domain-containing protein [Desulfobacteraceae bacterium]|nr:MAG: DUF362 domain-containing protein [Desulfobacteraceae bacterium]